MRDGSRGIPSFDRKRGKIQHCRVSSLAACCCDECKSSCFASVDYACTPTHSITNQQENMKIDLTLRYISTRTRTCAHTSIKRSLIINAPNVAEYHTRCSLLPSVTKRCPQKHMKHPRKLFLWIAFSQIRTRTMKHFQKHKIS